MCIQEIKKDNEAGGIRSCKIVLYRKFLQYGVKTWDQVIEALKNIGCDDIAEEVKMRLLKDYSKVNNQYNNY